MATSTPPVSYQSGKWICMKMPEGYRFVRPSAITQVIMYDTEDALHPDWEVEISGETHIISAEMARGILEMTTP